MKRLIIVIACIFIAAQAYTQADSIIPIAPNTYLVNFTDKNDNGYSIDEPGEFLSSRALERRQRYNISVTEQDLPVTKAYTDSLEALGFEIYAVSKWFNHAVIYTEDTALLNELPNLSFVRFNSEKKKNKKEAYERKNLEHIDIKIKKDANTVFDYGNGQNQAVMINAHYLHNRNFQGQGMLIAILDAGFYKADELPSFDSLFANEQIKGIRDFVARDDEVFEDGSHGMQVLSTIAANLPGKLVGTAPKADFVLGRTEDGATEYIVEEYYWISGAEYADSIGADIINTSLGYTKYDDNIHCHSYEDMDGNTAPISIASSFAAARGMLLVTSAGNEGNDEWKYISAPADSDSILTVGSVGSRGQLSNFSSRGPTADGRIKPDVVAQGSFAFVQGNSGGISFTFGTSFSGPIVTGAVACLWQAYPEFTAQEIIEVIRRSGDRYDKPNNDYGFGIPDFAYAYEYLSILRERRTKSE